VSHPWNRTLRLRLEPQRVCGFLLGGWPRQAVLAETSRAVSRDAPVADASAAPDLAAQARTIGTVMQDLAAKTSIEGAKLRVELADSLVHLDVAEGDFADHRDSQLSAVAAACVAEMLGDEAEGCELRWQLQSDERHLFICAVGRAQLQALRRVADDHGLQLDSLQADFSLQWNRHARALGRGAAVFAVASEDDAVIACVDDGVICCVSSGQWLDADAGGTSRPQVERLLCSLGMDRQATAGMLDNRADRLLASLGRDAAAQSSFVLVAPDISSNALSSRWKIIDREASAA